MSICSSRRSLLKQTAALAASCVLPTATTTTHAAGTDPVVVILYLRGGADGMNIVAPYQDEDYYRQRNNIALSANQLTDLDGFFGLHNGFTSLLPMYTSRELSFIHAVGTPVFSGSHFFSQDAMASVGGDTGWLHRTTQAISPPVPYASISMGKQTNKAFLGSESVVTVETIAEQQVIKAALEGKRPTLAQMYGAGSQSKFGPAVDSAFSSLDVTAGVVTESTVSYPEHELAIALAQVAAMIKANIGARVFAIEYGGWDHHTNLTSGLMNRGLTLANALAAFRLDLGEDFDRTLLLGVTEFGRRVKVNGTGGTDHGHGSCLLAMGGGLKTAGGGRVLLADNAWPGLSTQDLINDHSLQVTTDYRDVFAEILDRHLGLGSHLGQILPGHSVDEANYPGLFAS